MNLSKLCQAATLALVFTTCSAEKALSAVAASPVAAALPPPMSLGGVDLYGSSRLTLDMVKRSHGVLLQKCIDDTLRGDAAASKADNQKLSDALINDYHLAFAKLSIIEYFNLNNVPGRQAYVTVDVVEKGDAARRMDFLARPKGHFPDPDGLLKAWDDYQNIGFELMQSGEISGARVECPAFHCIFGHDHPRLAPFKEIFVAGAAKHKADLVQIFLGDERDEARANAAFLLAYTSDGNDLVRTLSKRITDEAAIVRNNIVRVFSDIAQFHQDLAAPVEKILPLLDYPETTDRNKASAFVFGLVSNKAQLDKYRPVVLRQAVPVLLRTLRLQQPNNHDFAYMILRAVSGQEYGERDYAAWDAWYRSQPASQPQR